MEIVTVSTKYQVVIPKSIRKKIELKPGQKFQILYYEDRLEFILVRKAQDMRGFLKGMDTSVKREADRL